MSRRTERPYKVDGAGKLARHSAAPCSVPEINGPVVQSRLAGFTFLLRETCGPSLSATAGTVVSNDHRAGQESAEAIVPGATSRETKPDGLTTREGLNLAGRHDRRWSCPGAMKPTGRATGSDHRGRERVLRHSARTARNPDASGTEHLRWCGRREGKLSRRPD